MAKKNLSSLMSGIIGDKSPSLSPAQPEVRSEEQPVYGSETTKRKPGRPVKNPDADDVRATFMVSEALLRKLKYICLMDDLLQKDLLNAALSDYIAAWEVENGEIAYPKKNNKGSNIYSL